MSGLYNGMGLASVKAKQPVTQYEPMNVFDFAPFQETVQGIPCRKRKSNSPEPTFEQYRKKGKRGLFANRVKLLLTPSTN